MSVTQTRMALGQWSVRLKPGTPQTLLDSLAYYGHVAITTGRVDPRVDGDSLLRSARYVGVLRAMGRAGDGRSLSGPGMAMWLGDEDDKGPVITVPALTFTGSTFTAAVRAALEVGQAVVEGTLHPVTGAYTGIHQWETSRKAITYICSTMTADSDDPVEWRVNGDGTLDAGLASQLYVTDPVAAIVRNASGADGRLRLLPGQAGTTQDVADFTTRVALLAQGDGHQIATGGATLAPGLNPYLDLHGNPVDILRMVSESGTVAPNANARAAMQLGRFVHAREALTLSTTHYDITGDVRVGDWVWVHDPDVGLVDPDHEIVLRGQRINPAKLRVVELSWPVTSGMSVAYRGPDGTWQDLTDYVVWETGQTTVVVGGYDRSLTSGGGEQLGSRAMPNTSIPAAPALVLPFRQSVYQSTVSGITKAQVEVAWSTPANTDGSAIIDGHHYEVQYRTSASPVFPVTWGQLGAKTWGELHTWGNPLNFAEGPWQTAYVEWDDQFVLLQELTPGIPYDIRVRAVDSGAPPNVSDWSAVESVQTVGDTIAPSAPAAPEVVTSRMSVQIIHRLGRSDGGQYNLEPDLQHLEVHASYEPNFYPDDTTRIGKILANNGMILAQIPAVGTLHVESVLPEYYKVVAVDEHGNKSLPSEAAVSTATLIDDAHISDLTVSKITAGTITAGWILAGSIKTATSGARMETDHLGLRLYNAANQVTVNLNAANGDADLIGTFSTGQAGERLVINPTGGGLPEIYFYPSDNSDPAYINALYNGTQVALGLNSGPTANDLQQTTLLLQPDFGRFQYNDVGTNERRGGWVWVTPDNAGFGVTRASTSIDAYYLIDSDENHYMQGTYLADVTLGGQSALYCGYVPVAAGFGGIGMGYGATMAGRMCPIASASDGSGTNYTAIYTATPTGFNIGWANAAGSKAVHYWVFRV
jgi:hypothetical protein